MIQRVIVALQHLRERNRKITKRAIDKLVQYSCVCKRYPMVRTLVEGAIQAQRTPNESNKELCVWRHNFLLERTLSRFIHLDEMFLKGYGLGEWY
jgi:hypothetical protein